MKKKPQSHNRFLRKQTLNSLNERRRMCKQDQLDALLLGGRTNLTGEEETAEDRQHDHKISDELEKSFDVEYPDRQVNGRLVGRQAVNGFYRHYKRLAKIRDQNKTADIRSSVYTSMLEKCQQLSILPSKIGLVKYEGKPDEVKLGHSRYGRKYLSALSEGMKEVGLTSCHLNSNRINQQTLQMLAPNLPRSLVSIRLQNNQIGGRGIEAFHRFLKEDVKLVELDLSSNNLTDSGTSTLCTTLKNHQRIRILNLSRNCITCRSASHIASLIQNGSFEEIYLQWNRIRSKGGKEILQALEPSLTIKVFDMSWNMVGGSLESCTALCNLIRINTELVHCDFSGNSFTLDECKLVAEALSSNSSIYGFHFKGNFGHVNCRGQLVLEEGLCARDYRQVSIHNRMDNCQLRQHTKKDLCEELLRDCCWICQGWLQKEIVFESNCEPDLDLWVHFSFQGYRSRYLGRIEHRQHRFRCMVPPRKVYFFFTYNDQQVASKAHESVCLFDNSRLRFQLEDQQLDCHVEDRNVLYEGEIGHVIDSQYKVLPEVKPREAVPMFIRSEGQRPLQLPDQDLDGSTNNLRKAFEVDWSFMRIHSLLANQQAFHIHEALFKSYELIWQYYHYYSCLCTSDPNGYFIDQEALLLFLLDNGLLDEDLTKEDVMECFQQILHTSQKELDGTSYPYDAVTCFRFLQLLVRVAPLKYPQYEHSDALELVLLSLKKNQSNLLQPHEHFRVSRYRAEQCDSLLRRSKVALEELFFHNCSSYWRIGQKKFLYFEDFKDIFDRNCTSEKYNISGRQLRLAFFYAKRGVQDYYESDAYRRLFLSEFPQALSRAALFSDCEAYRDNHLISLPQKITGLVQSITGQASH